MHRQKVCKANKSFMTPEDRVAQSAGRVENHTEQCARNCIFFNNPPAYGRALAGLFCRPIVLD